MENNHMENDSKLERWKKQYERDIHVHMYHGIVYNLNTWTTCMCTYIPDCMKGQLKACLLLLSCTGPHFFRLLCGKWRGEANLVVVVLSVRVSNPVEWGDEGRATGDKATGSPCCDLTRAADWHSDWQTLLGSDWCVLLRATSDWSDGLSNGRTT